jgi:hypothetical protein
MASTKARESLARVRIGMNRTATEITRPDLFPSISLAMKESPLPWYLAEVKAAPRQHGPDDYPEGSGQVAELGGKNRPEKGPAAAMAAKWWPKRTYLLVVW